MMRGIIFRILVITLSVVPAFGQGHNCEEDLFPKQHSNRQWGYINIFGQWRINAVYSKTFPFSGNTAIVLKGGKYGAISCEAKVILKTDWDEIKDFKAGKAWIRKGQKWGLVNEKGQILIEPEIDKVEEVSRFSDFTWLLKGDVWGLYNVDKGEYVFKPQFALYKLLTDNTSLVKLGDSFGVVGYNEGGYLIKPVYDGVAKVAPYTMAAQQGDKWGLIHDKGLVLLEPTYDSIESVHKLRLRAWKDGKCVLLNIKGAQLSRQEYSWISPFVGGASKVSRNGKLGYVSMRGTEVIHAKYDAGGDFYKGRAIVRSDSGYNVINPRGENLLPEYYLGLTNPAERQYYIAQTKKGYVILDYGFEKAAKDTFDNIGGSDPREKIRVYKDGKWWFHNLYTQSRLFDREFDDVFPFVGSTAIVKQEKGWGVVNSGGDFIAACEFDNISTFGIPGKKVFVVRKGDKIGWIDEDAKTRFEPKFDELILCEKNRVKVLKDALWGLYDWKGTLTAEHTYTSMEDSTSWPCIASVKKKYGLVDEKGTVLGSMKWKKFERIGEKRFKASKGKSWVLISQNGTQIGEEYENVGLETEGWVPVQKEGKWGFLDSKGKVKVDCVLDSYSPFQSGLADGIHKGKKVRIDKRGKILPVE